MDAHERDVKLYGKCGRCGGIGESCFKHQAFYDKAYTVEAAEKLRGGVFLRRERHPYKREGRSYFSNKWGGTYWKPYAW